MPAKNGLRPVLEYVSNFVPMKQIMINLHVIEDVIIDDMAKGRDPAEFS